MNSIHRMIFAVGVFTIISLGITPVARAVEIGDKAPDFELDSTTGSKLKLSGFQGKKNVVIQFYVLDYSPG